LLCTLAAAAQAPTENTAEMTQHDTAPTFSSGINLVLVPVVVRDSAGHAIGTLHREDFQLFDKSKPQFISKFSIERPAAPLIIPNAGIEIDAEGNEKAAPANTQPIATRFVAWLFDDIHLSIGDLLQVRQAARTQLASLEKGARAGIFTTSGRVTVDFTDDRDKLDETIRRILPAPTRISTIADCPDITYYQADLIVNKNDPSALQVAEIEYLACNPPPSGTSQQQALALAEAPVRGMSLSALSSGDHDTQLSLGTIKTLIRRMALLPGSRTIVLLSPGFFLTIDHRTEEGDVIDRAIRSNVVISALDARGVYVIVPGGDASQASTGTQATSVARTQMMTESMIADDDIMAELSAATGGSFAHNTNDLAGGLKQIAAQPEFIYVLGFSPQDLKFDGSYHGLKVSLTKDALKTIGSGYQIQGRRGYYVARHATDPAEQAKQEIEEAFFSRDEIKDLPVELHTQFFKTEDFKARVSILARIDAKHLRYAKADGRNKNTLTIIGGLFDRNGNYVSGIQKTLEMKLKDHTLETMPDSGITVRTNLDVATGTYVVRLVVRDSEGQTMSAQNSVVEIP
jgi:VWFA-related protein